MAMFINNLNKQQQQQQQKLRKTKNNKKNLPKTTNVPKACKAIEEWFYVIFWHNYLI
jgi:hypothetical protein